MTAPETHRPASPSRNFPLGIAGFSYADTFEPARLAELTQAFYEQVRRDDPDTSRAFDEYRHGGGQGLSEAEIASRLIRMARHLGRFLSQLWGCETDAEKLVQEARLQSSVFVFKGFLSKRAFKAAFAKDPAGLDFVALNAAATLLQQAAFPDSLKAGDEELGVAQMVSQLLELEESYEKALSTRPAAPVPEEIRARYSALRRAVAQYPATRKHFEQALQSAPGASPEQNDLQLLHNLLDLLARWSVARLHHPEAGRVVRHWVSYRFPLPVDFSSLVKVKRPRAELPEAMVGEGEERRRDGFKLTDRRMGPREVLGEVDYCLYCHERGKDSCSKGLVAKEGGFKKSPLGVPLPGCPLDERISEAHLLKREGQSLGALAMIALDNPMLPGTGHRICNDCMRACIFQKQDPVNIPQIETGILTDVLALPYGVEIYGLLTRWNPLSIRRPHALSYNGKNVMVVGMGPAGYTLAQHLLNEGFGVVGVDGLKIEPLPQDLVGADQWPPRAVKEHREILKELDQRTLAGFGGVAEYGITVRWDKNFLTLLHLTLARRDKLRLFGGTRFGGTVAIEDAFALGIDHIAIAAGAGRPTLVEMKNNLARGIRKASDFLMGLQLSGAFKTDSLANLQVRLPALVIGGGLTAIDAATELAAYYPVQVEKVLKRYEQLCLAVGEEKVLGTCDAEEKEILATFLDHGRQVRAERARAEANHETPDFAPLVKKWGGASLVYRKSMADSPAYRLNHEEIIKGLEEGITFVERLSPVEAVVDKNGSVEALKLERLAEKDGKWVNTGEIVTLPARTVLVAAGTSPNIIYEKEHPGTFELDPKKSSFKSFRMARQNGARKLEPAGTGELGFFTSYQKDGRYITYYGDNHPVYAGSVVRAMASAKDGFPHVVALFAEELARLSPAEQPAREASWKKLAASFEDGLRPTVVKVQRLTPTIVEVTVRAPFAARRFEPGQFYRLQNFEADAPEVLGSKMGMEGLALTGAWVDKEKGLLSLIVLELGGSSRLCSSLTPGQRVVVMGPTGAPTEIPRGQSVLLLGGGLGNAVLFSIAKALKENGNRVLYFAGYKKAEDVFKRDEIETATDQVIWSVDVGPEIKPRRPQDRSFQGNIVQSMLSYAQGKMGETLVPLNAVDRIIAIGSDRMMAAVKHARREALAPYLKSEHVAVGSINSPMQCMMKEVCAQCLQKHVDPKTGAEAAPVFSCFNQDQHLDEVDFKNLNERLKANSVLEKLTNLWVDRLFAARADQGRMAG